MKNLFCAMLLSITVMVCIKNSELYDITQNNQKQILDLSERSYYIGCRRFSENHKNCAEFSNHWRRELSITLAITDIHGSVLNEDNGQ